MTAAGRLASYAGLLLGAMAVAAATLWLVHVVMTASPAAPAETVAAVLRVVFFLLTGAAAIVLWPILLLQESRRAARDAMQRHTVMLEREIEARREAEAALQAAKETAEAASLAKSKYVRGISHELRTPLNAVLGYAQLLETSSALPPALKHSVRVIRRSGAHLSDLVDGLLDISMIEAGKLQIYRDEIAFPDFLNQIVDMFSLQARQKGLDFLFDPPAHAPTIVRADEKRLRQVLINLLSNALRNTPQGTVTLRVRYSGEVCRFDIEDTGVGIAPQDMQRIFLPFERVDAPGPGVTRGAGLGLTITKLLTQAMGGEISAVSAPGAGSVFSVRLLLSASQSAGQGRVAVRRETLPPPTAYRGARRTILAADDDPDHLGFVRDALSPLGFTVVTAHDGPSCLAAAAAAAPDAVLLDISMPGLSGWETAAALRARGSAPVIMISADPRAESQRAASAGDHDAYLMKPLDVGALLETLGALLALEWVRGPAGGDKAPEACSTSPALADLESLRQLGRIGHVRGILHKLDEIGAAQPDLEPVVGRLRRLAEDCDLDGYAAALQKLEAM